MHTYRHTYVHENISNRRVRGREKKEQEREGMQ